MPRPEFQLPRSEVQVAKVTANADPKNQGRVQVQFDWQSGSDTTDWIRVMTPDAGGSDKVSKNRGFMAIPEIGDQVMVGFQHQLPDRPFVMGSMFHGKVGGGGGAGNNVKSLSGKSGNIICLNDGAGIEIKDKAGNHVTLSGTGDVTTTVSNNSTENIGNELAINATTSVTITVGNSKSILTMNSSGEISIYAETKMRFEAACSSISMDADKIEISAPMIVLGADNIGINGKDMVMVTQGSNSKATFSGNNTAITGNQVDIN